jgi:hypothetical protein
MQWKFVAPIFALGLAFTLVPLPATTITTYSSLSTWAAATSPGYQTVTFTGMATPGSNTNYYSPTGVTADGVEFIGYSSTGSSDMQVIDTSAFSWYNWGSGDALIQSTQQTNSSAPLPYISIVLPANVSALGLNLFSTNTQGMTYSITVAGNQYNVPTFTQPTLAFWGVTSSAPISSLTLSLEGTVYSNPSEELADNFSFGASDISAAPEAGTYLLIGTGLIGFVMLRKRLVPRK